MIQREEGHKLLARLGKTKLRPGGIEATNWLLEQVCIDKNKKILEVACNMGTTLIHLVKEYNIEIYGVDKDKEALKKAMENVKLEGLEDKIHLIESDAKKLPFEDNTFDIIINEAMLTMLSDKDKKLALEEYYRILKPSGTLLTHDIVLQRNDKEKVNELRKVIHIPAVPLILEDWLKIYKDAGYKNIDYKSNHMTLMSQAGLTADEGEEGMAKIMENAEKDENFSQFFEMKKFFDENYELFYYISIKSEK